MADVPTPYAAAAGAPVVNPQIRREAEQHLQRGLDHYDRGEFDQALQAYYESIQTDPTFALGYNNMGMVLIDLERYQDAIEALCQAIRCAPEHAEAYNNLGFVLRRIRQDIQAASAYTRFLELEPEVEEASRIRTWIGTVMQQNNLTEIPPLVIPGVPAAVEPPPVTPPVQPVMTAPPASLPAQTPPAVPPAIQIERPPVAAAPAPATAEDPPKIKKISGWEMPGDPAPESTPPPPPDAAPPPIAPTTPAVPPIAVIPPRPPLPPKPPTAAVPPRPGAKPPVSSSKPAPVIPPGVVPPPAAPASATALKATGDPAKDAIALVERGMDLFAGGELEEAAKFFEKASQADPSNGEGLTGMAKVLIRQEKSSEAVELLQRAVKLAPEDPAAYYVLGFALRSLERNVEAAEAYEEFLRLLPKAADTEKMRQWVAHVKGAETAAPVDEEDNTADEGPLATEIDKPYKKALTIFQAGQTAAALDECIAILNMDAGHFRTRVLLGRCLLRQKNFDSAIEQFEGALVTQPEFPEALYFLGQATEKRGLLSKAVETYQHYLKLAPEGPRLQRVKRWLAARESSGAPGVRQVQCELCLRLMPESEITSHDGKATCHSCLMVMGAVPMTSPSGLMKATPDKAASKEAPAEQMPVARRPSKKLLAVAAVVALLAGGGVLWHLQLLTPILQKLGLWKAPEPPVVARINNPVRRPPASSANFKFDASKVKIANEPPATARPYARWSYKPELTGVESLAKDLPDWQLELTATKCPEGMKVEDKSLVWTPTPTDNDILKKGLSANVALTIEGHARNRDGAVMKLFSLSKSFSLQMQFGYEMGAELDTGLDSSERPAIATTDLNGDRRSDTVIGSGDFRKGAVRFYVPRSGNPLPVPILLATGGRYSAVVSAPLQNPASQDIVAANWLTGQIRVFFQQPDQPIAGPVLDVGSGPIALAAADMNDDQQPEIATLLSVGQNLVISTLKADRTFSPPVRIPLGSGGSRGFVFPWTSQELGRGFLTIVPQAPAPLQFVPWNNGQWARQGLPLSSATDEEGLIVAAVPLRTGPHRPDRLALVLGGTISRLAILEEKNGAWTSVAKPLPLPSAGLGLIACDFNDDGADDLFVVMLEECGVYFARGAGNFTPGLEVRTPRLLGPATLFYGQPGAAPDILVLGENRKAYMIRAIQPDISPAAAPTAAPAAAAK